MNADISISFIIVNYNGKDHLKECFNTLNKLNYPKDKLEFIMVDNGSDDGSVEYVKNRHKNVKIIQNSINEGFAKPNNDAAKVAKGDYIALINNDMKIDSNWINDMLESLDKCKDDKYVCIGSKILNWNGTKLDFAGGGVSFYGHGYQNDFGMDVDEANIKYAEDRDIMFACGGSMLIDRKVFLQVGGFDDDYFAYNEDVDLGWRLWLLGYKVRFCHKAICYHKHNSTSKKLNKSKLEVISNRNTLYTIFKNYDEDKVYKVLSAALLIKSYNVDDYSKEEFSSNKDMKIQSEVMVEFTNNMKKMEPKRKYIQEHRKMTDEEFISKFMDRVYDNQLIKFLYKNNLYNETLEGLVSSLQIQKQFGKRKSKMLIISSDKIGAKMAGPGIRYLEIGKQLSNVCDITIATPGKCDLDLTKYNIELISYGLGNTKEIIDTFRQSDIILIQGVWLEIIPELKMYCKDRIMIVDLYDPYTIENLEVHKEKDMYTRQKFHDSDLNALLNQIRFGDYFICANEKQKDFWIGMLAALDKINPKEFDLSNKLERLIGLVPFGISEVEPVHTRNALKEKIPNLKEDDKVFIWGGGVWNWFDPLTLIKAIAEIGKTRDDIKLFFLGVKHPNPDVPEMEMLSKTFELAEELGVRDKSVIFNMDWVEYNDRQNFLLEAHSGVSCHFDNLETRFSFRTRILDYLWARLPIIATEGDYFAEEIINHKLGLVVKFNDVDSVKNAILKIVDDKNFYNECKKNISEYREQYKWNVVTKPLEAFCKKPIKKKNESKKENGNSICDIKQFIKDELAGPIYGTMKIVQSFRCRYPNLSSIELMIGTYGRKNIHNLNFKLYESTMNVLIFEKKIDSSQIDDNSWLSVKFKPIINSEGREFYFDIEADENSNIDNSITLFRSSSSDGKPGLTVDGMLVDGNLTYKTNCILSDDPISEEDGIVLDSLQFGNNSDYEKNREYGTLNKLENTIGDLQKQMNTMSNKVYEINQWKNVAENRFDKIKKLNVFGYFKK